MTINTVNYSTAIDLAEEWVGKVNKIGFQFHTPFMKGDPLWLEFGKLRNDLVDRLIELRRKYPDFVINSEKQLSLMKGIGEELPFNVQRGPSFLWIIWEELSSLVALVVLMPSH
jgi:hypothetical protein